MNTPIAPSQQVQDGWQDECLYFEAAGYFHDLLADIENAREEIILESYIFALDHTGRSVLQALQRAAARRVRIRLLIDGVGSSEDAGEIAQALTGPATEIRIYHPLPWNFSAYRLAMRRGSWPIKFWRFVTEVNHRDHRKLCLVDEKIAWLGSFNICNSGQQENKPWHDTAVRLTGESIGELKQNFFNVWQHKTHGASRRLRNFFSNHSLKYRKQKNRELVRLLDTARQRIWITNAYFSPSRPLIHSLKRAVKRGVDVCIVVPSRSDIRWFPLLTRTFYADLLAAGLKIYEYRDNILHSKSILVDNQLIIGSTNLNYRSYFHDLELDAILSKPGTIHTMENKFLRDKEHSEQITLHRMDRFPRMVLLFGWFPRLLRYWL